MDPTLVGSTSRKTVPEWFELNSNHYGKDASFGGDSDCKDFPVNTSSTATLQGGCHLVITPDNVNDWQIFFRDQNGVGAVDTNRVQVSGSTVTATPASVTRFSQVYQQI